MLDINLQLDAFNIPALFQAKPAQIKKAHRRAMGKTLRWLNTRITRELGAQFDLPQRVFQVRAKKQFDADSGSLWIGLNPIAAHWLGRARQTKKGVSVRKHRFAGAFIAKMSNGHIGVFKRSSSKSLPIETVRAKIAEGSSADIEEYLERYKAQALPYFQRTFEHELNYIMDKAA